MPKPIDINFPEGRNMYYRMKMKLDEHQRKRQEYFKNREMTEWNRIKNEIEYDHMIAIRKALKEREEKEKLKEKMLLEEMKKEKERLEKEKKEKQAKKKPRCPKGKRRNKKTGNCETISSTRKKSSRLLSKTKKPRCPKGTRRNKKTGNCEKK